MTSTILRSRSITWFQAFAASALVPTSLTASAVAAECARLEIGPATSCAELQVKPDLRACGDLVQGSVKVRCQGPARAEVIVIGKNSRYQFKLRTTVGAWGGGGWEVAKVRQTPIEREPAGVVANPSVIPPAAPAAPVVAKEASAPPPPAAPAPQVIAPSAFQFAGYFDAYYARNFNRPSSLAGASARPQNNLHFYDWYANQLGLNLVEFTIRHQRAETAFLVDLDFGQMADLNAMVPSTAVSGGPNAGVVDEVSKHIGQAVFSYSPASLPGFVIEAGKMPTHVGYEVIKARDNFNYSRGALFSFGGPLWHTGFHIGYAVVPSRLVGSIYLYQGWNSIYENNANPTYGAQLKFNPTDSVTWVYNYIGGPEQAGNEANWKQVHESNVTWVVSPRLTLVADFLAGKEQQVALTSGTGDASWTGAELAAKWQYAERFALSPRLEVYRDAQGYTLGGDAQTLSTYTLTQSIQVSEGFETRLELRHDRSTAEQRFVTAGGGSAATQSIVVLGFLYNM